MSNVRLSSTRLHHAHSSLSDDPKFLRKCFYFDFTLTIGRKRSCDSNNRFKMEGGTVRRGVAGGELEKKYEGKEEDEDKKEEKRKKRGENNVRKRRRTRRRQRD